MIGGFYKSKDGWNRTSWNAWLGLYRKQGQLRVITHGFRVVEWPWMGFSLQWYWSGELVKEVRRYYA